MSLIGWKTLCEKENEYDGMQNFLISHNILVEKLILHYFA